MIHTPTNRFFVFLLATWSGFFVMSLELLCGRVIAPYYGNSIYVWGSVITVFMVSLAAGYYLGGQLSRRSAQLGVLGVLMIGAVVASLPLVLVGYPALDWLSSIMADPRSRSLAASAMLFMLPGMISGMVSPFTVRILTR